MQSPPLSHTIESVGSESPETAAVGAAESPAFEVQLEELRPLVRALVAEELERWLRQRSDCP